MSPETSTPPRRELGFWMCTALVVGNRRVKDVQIPTDLILADLAVPFGLAAREVIVRRIPTKRMPSRNSPSNVPGAVAETMSHEFILLLDRA